MRPHPFHVALCVLVATLSGCSWLGELLFTPPTDETLAARRATDAKPYERPWEEPDRKSPPGAYQPTKMWHKLVVLHTNDLRGQAYPVNGKGGLAQLAGEIERQRRKAELEGASVLVLDAGDIFSGSSLDGDRGEAIVDWMNRVGYDAWTAGVQDYEHGSAHLDALAQRAQFPLLGANIRHAATGRPPQRIQSFHVFSRGPLQIAVVGLVTPRANQLIAPARRGKHTFTDPKRSLKEAAGWLRDRKIHATILLNHQGIDEDVELAEGLRDATLVVSGSSDTSLESGGAVGKQGQLLLASTAGRARCLGKVELIISAGRGELLDARASVIDLDAKRTPPDRQIAGWLDKLGGGAGAADKPVLTLSRGLSRAPLGAAPSSSMLGNAVTDAMVAAGAAKKSELALIGRATLQTDLAKGAITRRQLDTAIGGAGGKLVLCKVKGSTLMTLLGESLRTPGDQLEVSASVVVVHDMARPSGDRLSDLQVAGDINRGRLYRVVMTERLAGSAVLESSASEPLGLTLREAIVRGLAKLPPIAQLSQKRLVPSGAGGGAPMAQMMLPDATVDLEDAKALYDTFHSYWSNWRGKGRIKQDASPGGKISQLTSVEPRVEVLLCVGSRYIKPVLALAAKHARKRFIVVTARKLEPKSLPANVTLVLVKKSTAVGKKAESTLLALLGGTRNAGGKVVDLRK